MTELESLHRDANGIANALARDLLESEASLSRRMGELEARLADKTLRLCRAEFRNFICEALAGFTFTRLNDEQFSIYEGATGAKWLATMGAGFFTFELIREALD